MQRVHGVLQSVHFGRGPVQRMLAIKMREATTAAKSATEAAVARGVYGAPALFVGDEMFFGKDSLDELEWWLTK